MITLYGVGGPNVAKTRASLLFKRVEFEHVDVDLVHQSDEFRELTPVGRVPVIRDQETVVCDSLFIAEYLDRRFPEAPRLFPEHLELRVRAYTTFALLERLYTIASPLVARAFGFLDLVEPVFAACSGYYPVSDSLRSELAGALNDKLEVLSRLLGDRTYFAGETCSQADFAAFALITYLQQIGLVAGPLADWAIARQDEFPFNAMFAPANAAVVKWI